MLKDFEKQMVRLMLKDLMKLSWMDFETLMEKYWHLLTMTENY
jgi:hypothetical protein